ncbi:MULTISPECIES: M42 family metallopeptidase [Methanoculleus]|jgi:putative aminopeptidase FrvX|uniref:Endoglucanase n=1 Tax=Methanoculleus thermophilus TaxID=2200 RepID=A0A1G8YMD2_9EURY|nr:MULTISPECIES: M42 family metallopeptidase [Methanoculleus]NLN08269.1 M42 family metallopeptidase [Methanoculleus thermophilus]SDK03887.1 endoglucanase [Methanoculleus thermophilus]HQD26461.1 M42 family metallopeptidase [Methanoculleus thermophilus]
MVKELLKKLSDAHGVTSREGNIRDIVRAELAGVVDEFREDKMGNLIAIKRGDGFSIMLAAHMDEIGLMVQYIDEKGFIRVVPLGGWFGPVLYCQRVILHGTKGPVPGVIGAKPPHVMKEEERRKEIKIEDMFIDVGAASAEEVKNLGIEIGTPITIDREYRELAGTRVTGKALDNRVGVAMLIRALQQADSPHTLYAVFTVQEELGLKGAKVSAYSLNPDCAIATDVTIPGDHPGIDKKDASVEMGKGPVLVLVSASGRGLMADPRMTAWLRETAEKNNIPYQLEVGTGGNTDATIIHLERGGIPSIPFSIPARYIHSPVEVVDTADIEAGVRLLVEALKSKPAL